MYPIKVLVIRKSRKPKYTYIRWATLVLCSLIQLSPISFYTMQLVSVVIFAALSTSSMAFNFTNPFTGSNTDSPTVQCASALTPPASLTNCSSAFGDLLSTNSSDSGLQMINSTIPTLCATLQSCNQTAYTDYANNINSSCQDILQSNPSGAIADIYYSALCK